MLERVRDVIQKYDNFKINTAFNGEFESGDKRANKVLIQKVMNSSVRPICMVRVARAYPDIAEGIPGMR